ncbi:hypothetical protein NIES4106_62150 (plasmid) [Fischerella sp. NIES-4106]|nr:hypothetical protein NIES4106_62150 [Fischerella sp. NIES-4106]
MAEKPVGEMTREEFLKRLRKLAIAYYDLHHPNLTTTQQTT